MFAVASAVTQTFKGLFIKDTQSGDSCSKCCGNQYVGFKTPLDAYNNSEQEKLMYTVVLPCDTTKPDYLVTIDTDPNSSTYSKVIGTLPMPNVGDELHHTGWNACISCKGLEKSMRHKYLVMPCLFSGNIYIVDVLSDPKNPKLHKTVSGEEVLKATGGANPHTSHCLPSGEVLISFIGREEGKGGGGFLLLDGTTFEIKGRWEKESMDKQPYGYDFWYQPKHNVMVSSEFGEPRSFSKGFDPSVVETQYGNTLTFYNWKDHTIINKVQLGPQGQIPLEVRYAHDPNKDYGFVGVALSSTIFRYFPKGDGTWDAQLVAEIPPVRVKGWALPVMPALITDILISLDDRFLYVSLWLHGAIYQYNIEDPAHPKLVGEVWLGGSLRKGGSVMPIEEDGCERPDLLKEIPTIQGKEIRGAPQMIQLSRDGKRLFVTSSLLRPWDKQFYPEMTEKGGQVLMVDVDTKNGGMKLNHDFYVNFDDQPFGPSVAHEMRYPGGDCSSDIWMAE